MQNAAHGKFSGKRLVVFGAGYIGSAVALQAFRQGASVTTVTRNASAAESHRAAGFHAITADIAAAEWARDIAPAPELVLYCASGGGAGLEGYVRSYVRGMETVLRWLHDRGSAATLIYTSSTSVYPQDGGAVVDESAQIVPPGEDRTGILAATEVAVIAAAKACARAFILRLAGIYGPGRHALLDEIRSGSISGRPDSRLNLIHREDAVSAIMRAFGAPTAHAGGVFNVSDGAPATRREIAEWVCARLSMPAPEFTGSVRATRRTGALNRVISNGKLRGELGWAPEFPSFRDGYAGLLHEPAGFAP